MLPLPNFLHFLALIVCQYQFVLSDIDIQLCNLTDIPTAITEHKYITNTNVDFNTYANHYSADTNIQRTRYLRNRLHGLMSMKSNLSHATPGHNNYFEVGFGPGATVNDIGQYFDNSVILRLS